MHRTSRRGSTGPLLAVVAIAALGLSGCGQLPETGLPTGSASVALPSERPSVSLPERTSTPSPTRTEEVPTATEDPSTEEPTTDAPTSDAPATPEPSDSEVVALPPATDEPSQEPTPESPTEEPTTPTPTPTETPTETPSPTSTASSPTGQPSPSEESASQTSEPPEAGSASASGTPAEGDGGIPLWVPLVALGGVVLGAILLLAGRSRKRQWDDRLGIEQAQAQWVLDELLPAMTNPATPVGEITTHWSGAQPTLDELQAGLGALVADAPDAARSTSAQTLAGAVGEVRQAIAADLALRSQAGPTPPAAGSVTPTDATIAAPSGAGAAGPVDPTALAASAARVASARERLAAALAMLG